MLRAALGLAGILGLALLGYALYYATGVIALGAGYSAKVMCSAVFVSRRDARQVRAEELSGLLTLLDTEVERAGHAVDASFHGLFESRAIHRRGLGCTLVHDPELELPLRAQGERYAQTLAPREAPAKPLPLAPSDYLPTEARARIESIVDGAFEEPDPEHPIRTRAVVVVHDGHVIAERYAPGIDAQTPLMGWSMTKSIINALVGILVGNGRLDVLDPAPIRALPGPNEPRRAVTIDALLRMTSGLDFDERTGPVLSDINRLLFLEPDVVAYASSKPLAHEPDTHWAYTGASSNLLAGVIRSAIGGDVTDYWAFPRRALFERIGMDSALIEPDSAGNLVGSSFSYATARDWARLGLLYLNDGVWAGQRILPEGWVAYTTRPTKLAPGLVYGAHWWLSWTEPEGPNAPAEPPIAYSAQGYEGQYVVVVPGEDLVVVRLGQTPPSSLWEMRPFAEGIIEALALRNPEPAP